MGLVFAEITLRNAGDVTNVRRGIMNEPEIRETTVTAMVDTGAATLILNEAVRQQLGLMLEDTYGARLADGSEQRYSYTEPVQVQWKNRKVVLQPVLIPNAHQVLLGAIPLEALDLIVNPLKEELTGAHGDVAIYQD